MKKKTDSLADFDRGFRAGLDTLRAGDLAAAAGLREAQVLARAFLLHEAVRLEESQGAAHPRLRTFKDALGPNSARLQELGQTIEVGSIELPQVGEQDASVHGRVVDSDRRGIEGLTACLVDARSQALPGIKPATTEASGYFAIVKTRNGGRKADQSQGIGKARAGVYLGVFGADGKSLYRSKAALKLAPGVRVVENVVLARRPDLPPSDKARKPADRRKTGQGEAKRPRKTETGAGTAAEILGRMAGQSRQFGAINARVGKLARRLGAASVETARDLEEFAAAEDREIRDRLRLPNLKSARAFKKLAARVLEKKK